MSFVKKYSFFVFLLVFVLFAYGKKPAFAASPWDDVWAAIEDLREQIAGIVATPGPAGATGEAGATGATGPIGLSGVTGATGPMGLQGIAGATGPAGGGITRSDVYTRYTDLLPVTGGQPATSAFAYCDDTNDVLLSGGFWVSGTNIHVFSSYGNPGHTTANWQVGAGSADGTDGSVQSSVVCLSIPN